MPELHRGHARDRPTTGRDRIASFPAVVLAQGFGLAAAALLVAGMPRLLATPARAAAPAMGSWRLRCAELRSRAAAAPRDTRSRLRLAEGLICQALWDGEDQLQRSEWASAADDRTVYHAYLNAALEAAPEVAEARSIAKSIAASDPDPRMRARAWERLASLAALEADEDARTRYAERAEAATATVGSWRGEGR